MKKIVLPPPHTPLSPSFLVPSFLSSYSFLPLLYPFPHLTPFCLYFVHLFLSSNFFVSVLYTIVCCTASAMVNFELPQRHCTWYWNGLLHVVLKCIRIFLFIVSDGELLLVWSIGMVVFIIAHRDEILLVWSIGMWSVCWKWF